MRGLYAVTPESLCDDALILACKQALAGGAVCLQYRAKSKPAAQRKYEASQLKALCHAANAEFIVNDDLALAVELGCGLHIGEHDCKVHEARAALGAQAVIGASCYDSLTLARKASSDGASYLAFGAFYPSATKTNTRRAYPTLLTQAREFALPIVAIGGITVHNAVELIETGADLIAVVNALFEHPDQVYQQAKAFSACFNRR